MSVTSVSATEYTCRMGLLGKTWYYRLVDNSLDISDEENKIKRQIDLKEIRRIQLFNSIPSHDPEKGCHDSEFCKLSLRIGKSVFIRSGTYLRPAGKVGEVVIDQKEYYDVFLTNLKKKICRIDPALPVLYGSWAASITGWLGVPLGLAFLAFAIGGFIMDELLTAVGIAVFSVPTGIFLIVAGWFMGIGYWPQYERIDQHLTTIDPEKSDRNDESKR